MKTLGGSKKPINAYASDIALPLNDDKLGNWYKKMAKNYGFKSAKLKVGLDQDSDLRRGKHKWLKRLDMYHELKFDEKEQANVKIDPKDFLEEAEKEKKELNESYKESIRQTKERT